MSLAMYSSKYLCLGPAPVECSTEWSTEMSPTLDETADTDGGGQRRATVVGAVEPSGTQQD